MVNFLTVNDSPITFGTDGWRGVLGVDFTLEKLLQAATAAAQELAYRAPKHIDSKKIIIGYDRRFLAKEMAQAISGVIRACELEPIIAKDPLPTPACSWAVVAHQALGALIITASHNPPEWLGLKIKAYYGGSVDEDFTKAVEKRLLVGGVISPIHLASAEFNGREEHINALREKFDVPAISNGIKKMGIKLFIDPMYGSAAGCLSELLNEMDNNSLEEIHSQRDTLFGGKSPEPLQKNLGDLISVVLKSTKNGRPGMGIVFDGDGDRIAAIGESGEFFSTQTLIPLFIDHLVRHKKLKGKVLKTVSGSDLIKSLSNNLGREVLELPVGFKYIASKMLEDNIVIGGEESGGIAFGNHLPERDAIYAALLLLEAIVEGTLPLSKRLMKIQEKYGNSFFDRIDLRLENMESRNCMQEFLNNSPPKFVDSFPVINVVRIDGLKLILDNSFWLMFRFSGTEPLLRIYCEAPTKKELDSTLLWAKNLITNQ